MIVQGLSEIQDESSDALLSKVSLWFLGRFKMQFPRIKRLHRIAATQGNSRLPVTVMLLDFNDKIQVLRNSPKTKGTCYRIGEDFSDRVHIIRKKLRVASTSLYNNGSSVHICMLRSCIYRQCLL